jgi:hypothetical protein
MALGRSDLKLKIDTEPSGNHEAAWSNAMNTFSSMMKQNQAQEAQEAKVNQLQGQQYGQAMGTTMQGVNQNLHLNQPQTAGPTGYVNSDPNFDALATYRNPYALPPPNSIYLTSDETQKEEIAPSGKDIQQFLDAMGNPKSYKYKDTNLQGTAEGKMISPMAQELEKSELSKEYVIDGEDGIKRVDYGSPRMMGLALSALAHLNQKVKKLEK